MVVKRGGSRASFDRGRVAGSVRKALKNRPVTADQVQGLVDRVEERMRRKGPEVTSEQVGVAVLADLRKLDQVAYIRFASVYKDFQELSDFQEELISLQKKVQAKPRPRR